MISPLQGRKPKAGEQDLFVLPCTRPSPVAVRVCSFTRAGQKARTQFTVVKVCEARTQFTVVKVCEARTQFTIVKVCEARTQFTIVKVCHPAFVGDLDM